MRGLLAFHGEIQSDCDGQLPAGVEGSVAHCAVEGKSLRVELGDVEGVLLGLEVGHECLVAL